MRPHAIPTIEIAAKRDYYLLDSILIKEGTDGRVQISTADNPAL
jgi:hypothetical protein